MKIRASIRLGLLLAAVNGVQAAEPRNPNAFESEIRAFEISDQRTPPPAHSVLFVGSSSFRLWPELPAAFPQWTILNRGFGGSTMGDLLHYYDRVVRPYRPQLIAVYEGDNDLANGETVAQILLNYREFLQRVTRDFPQTPVVLVAVKPSPSRRHLLKAQQELNAGMLRLATEQPRVVFADTFTPILGPDGEPDPRWFLADRLHLSALGYAQWTPILAQALQQADALRSRKSP